MNNVSVAIKITHFSLPVEELSTGLNLLPTHSHCGGEKYLQKTPDGMKEKTYEYNYWEYRQEYVTTEWPQYLINRFISEIVLVRKERLRQLSTESRLEFFIGIDCKDDANPGFHFDIPTLALLSEIKAELDIDMYCYSAG